MINLQDEEAIMDQIYAGGSKQFGNLLELDSVTIQCVPENQIKEMICISTYFIIDILLATVVFVCRAGHGYVACWHFSKCTILLKLRVLILFDNNCLPNIVRDSAEVHSDGARLEAVSASR